MEPARPELCSGVLPKPTSASSSNDEAPALVPIGTRASNSNDVSMSMYFRHLGFMEWGVFADDADFAKERAAATSGGGLNKSLRRRRMKIGL